MADQNDPLAGNVGGSAKRIEELKQINLEGAKVTATLEGLSKAFKNLGAADAAFLKEGIKSSAQIAGYVQAFTRNYKQNIGLAKELSGFTVNQLKSTKERRSFEEKVLRAQSEQATIQAQINDLIEIGNAAQAENDVINLQVEESKKRQSELEEKLATAKQQSLDITKKLTAESKQASDAQFASQNKIYDLQKKLEQLSTKEGVAQLEKQKGRKLQFGELAKIQSLIKKQVEAEQENIESLKEVREYNAKQIKDAGDIVGQLEEEIRLNKENIKTLEQASDELNAQAISADLLVDNLRAADGEIRKSLEDAEILSEKIKKVDNASGSLLKSFATFGQEVLGNVPIVGQAFNALFKELQEAHTKYTDAVAQGTSKMGARFKALQGIVKGLTLTLTAGFVKALVEGTMKASEAAKIVTQGLGGGAISAANSMAAASEAASKLSIPLAEAASMVGELNDALGTSLGFNGEILTTFGTLTKKIGVSAGAAAKLVGLSASIGANFKDVSEQVIGVTEKMNALNGIAVSPKAVFEELGNASATTLRNIGKSPEALIKAAAGARALGLQMSEIAAAGEKMLDFENSMQKEMEAELLLGKDLQLDRLRAAAATGDQATMQEELKRLVMENKDQIGNNVLAQQQFADALGISRDEYNEIIKNQDKLTGLTEQDAARKQANAKNEKLSAEEIGKRQMQAMERVASLADRLAKFFENIQLGAKKFFDSIMVAIKPILDVDFSGIMDTFKTDGFVAGIKKAFNELWPAIKESVGNLGTLVLDTFKSVFAGGEGDLLSKGGIIGQLLGAGALTGGALTIGLKVAGGAGGLLGKAFGGIFGKRGSSRNKPLWTRLSDGMDLFSKFGGKFGGKVTKLLSKVTGGKATAVGRALRGVSAKMMRPGLAKAVAGRGAGTAAKASTKILGKASALAGKAALKSGAKIAARIGANALKAIPVVGQVAAIGMAAYDAFQGVKKAGEFFGKDQKDATGGEKTAAAFGSALSGLTFGLLDAGKTARGLYKAGEWVGDKVKQSWEKTKEAAKAFGGWVSKGWDNLKQGFSNIKEKASEIANNVREKVGEFANSVKEKAVAAKDAILGFASNVKDKAVAAKEAVLVFASNVKGKALEFANTAKDAILGFGSKVKDRALEFANTAKERISSFAKTFSEGISNFASNAKEKISSFVSTVGEGISNFASNAKEKISSFAKTFSEGASNFANSAKEKISSFASSVGSGILSFTKSVGSKALDFANAVGDKVGAIKNKVSEFVEANGGLIGAVKAAAVGLASKAKETLGNAWNNVKTFFKGEDKSKAVTKEKQEPLKEIATPIVQMTVDQTKQLTTAFNTALAKGAEATTKAVNEFGNTISPYITNNEITVKDQLQQLKDLKAESDNQHKAEIAELRRQTRLMYETLTDTQKSTVIKMDSFKVGEALVARY